MSRGGGCSGDGYPENAYVCDALFRACGEESLADGDAAWHGVEKRPDAKAEHTWQGAMRPGKCRALNNNAVALTDQTEGGRDMSASESREDAQPEA